VGGHELRPLGIHVPLVTDLHELFPVFVILEVVVVVVVSILVVVVVLSILALVLEGPHLLAWSVVLADLGCVGQVLKTARPRSFEEGSVRRAL